MEQLPPAEREPHTHIRTQQELIDGINDLIEEYTSRPLLDGEEVNLNAAYRLRQKITGEAPPDDWVY